MEAHGGYTFCGLAALVILKKECSLNLKSLLVSVVLSSLVPAPGEGTQAWEWANGSPCGED